MDINEYQKIAIPKMEAGKMVEIVRKTIKDVEYMKQDKYEEQKEVYKPIIENLEKEISGISKFKKEFKKIANKPITYIQQQQALPDQALPDQALPDQALPDQALPDQALPDQALPDVEPKFADLDAGFTEKDKAILSKYELPMPFKLFTSAINDDDIVASVLHQSGKLNQELGGAKGSLSSTKKNRKKKCR